MKSKRHTPNTSSFNSSKSWKRKKNNYRNYVNKTSNSDEYEDINLKGNSVTLSGENQVLHMKRKGEIIIEHFNNNKLYCHYCETPFRFDPDYPNKFKEITLDHIIPVTNYQGGFYDSQNIVLSCKFCNEDKSNMDYELYQKYRLIPINVLISDNFDELWRIFFKTCFFFYENKSFNTYEEKEIREGETKVKFSYLNPEEYI